MNEKAIEYNERSVQLAPNGLPPWLVLAGLYAQADRDEEAKKQLKKYAESRQIFPGRNMEGVSGFMIKK